MIIQYGPIFREKIGSQWIAYIKDTTDIRKIYHNEGKYPYRGDLLLLEKIYCKKENKPLSVGGL